MKSKEEYLKIRELYTALTKKAATGFFILIAALVAIGLFIPGVMYIGVLVLLIGGYLLMLFAKTNRVQIHVSFGAYFSEYLTELQTKTKVLIPQSVSKQMEDDELKQIFGDKLDFQFNLFVEGPFEYMGSSNTISKVTARKYENQLQTTHFNGYLLKIKLEKNIGDFLYTSKENLENYQADYKEFEIVNLLTKKALYVLDDNDYNQATLYVSKLEETLGDDITVFTKGDYVYITTNYKINVNTVTFVDFTNFNEEEYEAVVNEYIKIYNLCSKL